LVDLSPRHYHRQLRSCRERGNVDGGIHELRDVDRLETALKVLDGDLDLLRRSRKDGGQCAGRRRAVGGNPYIAEDGQASQNGGRDQAGREVCDEVPGRDIDPEDIPTVVVVEVTGPE